VTGVAEHEYVSTACQHELHAECRKTCKFCAETCRCGCHVPAEEHECFPELGTDEHPIPPWCLDGRVFNPCGAEDGCDGSCGTDGDCLDGPCSCDCHKEEL
jgi:hypothetical protein